MTEGTQCIVCLTTFGPALPHSGAELTHLLGSAIHDSISQTTPSDLCILDNSPEEIKRNLQQKILRSFTFTGTAVAQWLRCCATNRKVAGSVPANVIGFFIDIKSFRSLYGPAVDSASNRNEYQEHFLG